MRTNASPIQTKSDSLVFRALHSWFLYYSSALSSIIFQLFNPNRSFLLWDYHRFNSCQLHYFSERIEMRWIFLFYDLISCYLLLHCWCHWNHSSWKTEISIFERKNKKIQLNSIYSLIFSDHYLKWGIWKKYGFLV